MIPVLLQVVDIDGALDVGMCSDTMDTQEESGMDFDLGLVQEAMKS